MGNTPESNRGNLWVVWGMVLGKRTMKSSPLTFGSLFAGIGGWDLGLEALGMECKWQVEIDPFCLSVLERHWPDVPKYQDVFGVSGSTLEAVDAICGGFPCQPVSLVGQRKGTSDPRWLWPEFARLVAVVRPKYVLVENVPGLYSQGGAEVAADLATLRYDYQWGSLSARAVGAPHRRERFFLVAYSGSQRRQQEPGSSHGDEKPYAGGSKEDNNQSERHGEGRRSRGVSRAMAPRSVERERANWESDPAEDHESRMGRMAYGVPQQVDRRKALGNALVPQMAMAIGQIVINMEMNK